MQTIQTRERTDPEGTLTVRVPLGRPDTEFDVVLVVQPKAAANGTPTAPAANRFAVMDAIRNSLAATGRDFGDSVEDIREDRDR
ncbi:MAG: hypothetical protein J2P46_21390 [Zavarzinella sp.]|nr:hypothetical protein [Zavarzinella sp.]